MVQEVFGDDLPELIVHAPLPIDEDDHHAPTAKTGVALGLLVSAFARTEFQAVQFMPAFIFPQILICGLFVPLAALPPVLEAAAYYVPLTYAVDALNLATQASEITGEMWRDVWVVAGFIAAALVLASLTLRRRST